MKRSVCALLLTTLLGACSDGPSGPEPVREIEILQGGATFEEQALPVGGTLQLSAALKDGGGKALNGRPVAWRSTLPSVASVDSTGLVTGLTAGSALIVASADAAADTARITVMTPVSSDVACAPGDAGLSLGIGEVHTTTAASATLICLNAGGNGAEYVYVPFHAASSGNLAVEIAATGVGAVTGPPNPALFPLGPSLARVASGATEDAEFHHQLRRWEREHFAPGRAASAALRPSYSLSGSGAGRTLAVGDTIRLNVNADQACSNPDQRLGRVEAVSSRAIVVADSANPDGGFTRAEYEEFGRAFDDLVWSLITSSFDAPSDIDANQRVIILFTKAVNDRTEEGSTSYVAGFFHPRDLYARSKTGESGGCAASNEAEMFYMLVPDSARAVREKPADPTKSPFHKDRVKRGTTGVIAHEFQHLINFARRLANKASGSEEVWLNEGLSHIAEELMFYSATGLAPERNITLEDLRAQGAITAVNAYQVSNFGRFKKFLESPADQSPIGVGRDDDLATRGAAWAFLRYAADRKTDPGSQRQIWRQLVNSSTTGVESLSRALGVDPLGWMQDWAVSVYADDAGLPVAERYRQQSWNYRSVLPALSEGKFPLSVVPLQSGVDRQTRLSLQGGGAAYLRFGIAAGEKAAIRTTSAGITGPAKLKIAILRTR